MILKRFRVVAGLMAVAALGAGLFTWPRLHVAAEPSTGYHDLPATHWTAGAVARLTAAGMVAPDQGGNFRPGESISRGELSHWLLAARHIVPPRPRHSPFPDVPASSPIAGVAETAYRLALFDLDAQGCFRPDAPVTRQEAVLAAMRVSGRDWAARAWDTDLYLSHLPFRDTASIDEGFRRYVASALRDGLVQGPPGSRFEPKAPLTRAAAAALVARLLLPDESPAAPVEAGVNGPTLAPARGSDLRPVETLTMLATAYGAGEPWLSDITYSGIPVRRGLVAVDPRVVPLGSILYVEGYGYALAADTGSAIKGRRIDLYSDDSREVALFGAQQRHVYVLE